MYELLVLVIFIWLLGKSLGLLFRLTWSVAKIIGGILLIAALPVLLLCLVFAGGMALLLPLAVVAAAAGILKAGA